VSQMFPNVPIDLLQRDLRQTHSVELTIENILEDRLFNAENSQRNNSLHNHDTDNENEDDDYEDNTSSDDDHQNSNNNGNNAIINNNINTNLTNDSSDINLFK
jgi:hypothetical protein